MKKSLFKSIKVLCLALIMLVNSIVPFTMAFAEDEIVYKFDASDPSTVPAPLFTNSYGSSENHSTNPYNDRLDQIPYLKLVGDELVYDAKGTETTSKKDGSTSNVDTYQTYIFGEAKDDVGTYDGKNVFSADVFFGEAMPYSVSLGIMRGPSKYYSKYTKGIMLNLNSTPSAKVRNDAAASATGWASALTANKWHNVTIEYNNKSAWAFDAKVYVDGVLVGSVADQSHSNGDTTEEKNFNCYAPVLIINTAYGSSNNFIKADLKMKNISLKNGDTAEAPAQTIVETDSGYSVKWVDAVGTTFQWQSSASQADGYTDIADATSYSFDIPQGYEGKYIRCAVTTAGVTSYTEAKYIPTDDGEIVYEFDASSAATVPQPMYVSMVYYRNDWLAQGAALESVKTCNPYRHIGGAPTFTATGDGKGEFKYVSNGDYPSYYAKSDMYGDMSSVQISQGRKVYSYQQYVFGGDGLITAPATGSKKYTFEMDVEFKDIMPLFYVGLQRGTGKKYTSNAGTLRITANSCDMREKQNQATSLFSKATLSTDKWYHISIVYDISATKVVAHAYIDGTPISETVCDVSDNNNNTFQPYIFINPDSDNSISTFAKSTITAKNIVLRKGEMIPDESIGKSSNDIHVKNLSDMCSTFKWQQSDSRDEGYTDINNETKYNLANLESLNGKWVRCVVTPSAESGEPQSGIITNAILVGGGSVANYNYSPVVGSNTLSASVSVHNQAENKVDFEILAAVYQDNTMVGVCVVSDLSLNPDADLTKNISFSFDLEKTDNVNVKFFALTKGDIEPLIKAIVK